MCVNLPVLPNSVVMHGTKVLGPLVRSAWLCQQRSWNQNLPIVCRPSVSQLALNLFRGFHYILAHVYGSSEPPCVKVYFGDPPICFIFFLGVLNRHEERKMCFGSIKYNFYFFIFYESPRPEFLKIRKPQLWPKSPIWSIWLAETLT